METRERHQPSIGPAHRSLHSIRLRLLGFVWMFCAALMLVIGSGLAFLGIGGHLLVRANPDTRAVINYDPGTIASYAPLPIAVGALLSLGFVLRARTYRP
jgi:hypothetical protein